MNIYNGTAYCRGETFEAVVCAHSEEEARETIKAQAANHDSYNRAKHLDALEWEIYQVEIDKPNILSYHTRG